MSSVKIPKPFTTYYKIELLEKYESPAQHTCNSNISWVFDNNVGISLNKLLPLKHILIVNL